jgi:hypothetical protein
MKWRSTGRCKPFLHRTRRTSATTCMQIDEIHSRLGEGGCGAGAGTGHHGGLEAHCGDGGREDRQRASDYAQGASAGLVTMATIFAADTWGTAGIDDAYSEFGWPAQWLQTAAVFATVKHCGGMGVHTAGGGAAFRCALRRVSFDSLIEIRQNAPCGGRPLAETTTES